MVYEDKAWLGNSAPPEDMRFPEDEDVEQHEARLDAELVEAIKNYLNFFELQDSGEHSDVFMLATVLLGLIEPQK